MTNRERVIMCALEAGIMVSTSYGQNSYQRMPVSDLETLLKFAELLNSEEDL